MKLFRLLALLLVSSAALGQSVSSGTVKPGNCATAINWISRYSTPGCTPVVPFLNSLHFSDTIPQAPKRGSLMFATGLTPKWSQLPVGPGTSLLHGGPEPHFSPIIYADLYAVPQTGNGLMVFNQNATINPTQVGGVWYVNPGCPELGACLTNILSLMPVTGGHIHIPALQNGACWTMSTPVVSNITAKVILIDGDPNATCINSSVSGTSFQLSWGTQHNIGGGFRDLELDAANCVANSNTGFDLGGGGGGLGAEMGFIQNVKTFCFDTGMTLPPNGNTFLLTMSHISVSGNAGVGCSQGIFIQNGENVRIDNSAVYQCKDGLKSTSAVDFEILDTSLDDNTDWGLLHTGTGIVHINAIHGENVGGGPAQYIKATNGTVDMHGGQFLEDRAAVSISTTTCSANVLTFVTTAAHHRIATEEVTIVSVGGTGTGANGDFTVASVTNSTTFTVNNTCTGTFTASTGTVEQTAFIEFSGADLSIFGTAVAAIGSGKVAEAVKFTGSPEATMFFTNKNPTNILAEFNTSYTGSRVISCPLRADAAVATCRYWGYNLDAPQGTVASSVMQLTGGNSFNTSGNWTMQKNGNTVNGVASSAYYGGRYGLSDDIAEDTSGNWGFRADVRAGGALTSGASFPAMTAGTAGFWGCAEGTAFTNVSGAAGIYCDSTTHEYMAKTNGAASAGMILRSQPGAIHVTAQTATKTIYTLCAASAGACNVAGQYAIDWYFNQGGTACSSVTAGSVTFALTWTDNAGAHSAVALAMNDQLSTTATSTLFHFTTSNTTAYASGHFNIWSTGAAAIQITNTYVACTTGTGTWELAATATRVQ